MQIVFRWRTVKRQKKKLPTGVEEYIVVTYHRSLHLKGTFWYLKEGICESRILSRSFLSLRLPLTFSSFIVSRQTRHGYEHSSLAKRYSLDFKNFLVSFRVHTRVIRKQRKYQPTLNTQSNLRRLHSRATNSRDILVLKLPSTVYYNKDC